MINVGKNVSKQVSELKAEKAKKVWVDVTDNPYNAKGDVVTDDTAAIQTAINTVSAAGGGTVFIPSGTFTVTSLVLPSKVEIRGINDQTSIIQVKTGATNHLFTLTTQKTYKCTLRNLWLKGNATVAFDLVHFVNDGLGPVDGFVDHYHQIENCVISGGGANGVYIQGSRENIFDKLKINNCVGHGFHYNNAHDSKISMITASYCNHGIYLQSASTLKVSGCKSFGCTGDGLRLTGCVQNVFTNCEFQNNNQHGVSLITCERVMFKNLLSDTNCMANGNYNELYLDGNIDIRIEGCLRQVVGNFLQTMIQFVTSIRDYQIDMVYLTAQNQKVAYLTTNNLVDAATNVVINGREIYNNTILKPNIMNSITAGLLEGFTLANDAAITCTSKFDGTAQQLNITANTGTGTRFIGIKFTVDVTKMTKVGFACAFEGASTVDQDYYRIRADIFQSGNPTPISTPSITTHTGDQTLVLSSVSIPALGATMDVYFEIGVKHNNNINYKIKDPKIMVGIIR